MSTVQITDQNNRSQYFDEYIKYHEGLDSNHMGYSHTKSIFLIIVKSFYVYRSCPRSRGSRRVELALFMFPNALAGIGCAWPKAVIGTPGVGNAGVLEALSNSLRDPIVLPSPMPMPPAVRAFLLCRCFLRLRRPLALWARWLPMSLRAALRAAACL